MSPQTAKFLLDLLGGLTLNAGAPDFEQVVTQVIRARTELVPLVAEAMPEGDQPTSR